MNRLWVRLTLMVMGIVILVTILPILATTIGVYYGQIPPVLADLPDDTLVRLRAIVLQMFPRNVLQIVVISVVIGTMAGFASSRYLTAPLQKLERGAREIGAQNLSQRVVLDKGSDEILAVAAAFNEMATKLERAEAMRQSLLADVAHELRTPLTVVQGNLRAILDDVYPLTKEEVARLYDQTRHLTHLVDDLHVLAQAESQRLPLSLGEVNVAKLVQAATAVYRPIAEVKGVTMRVELLGKLPRLQADAGRLTQVLHNLLNNAVRHTAAQDAITVQVEQVLDEEKRPWVEIRVQDTGEGMTDEQVTHVFDRFYRISKSRSRDDGGTGLGLAIVRALVEAHGGRVTAVSVGTNKGSRFVVSLPVGVVV